MHKTTIVFLGLLGHLLAFAPSTYAQTFMPGNSFAVYDANDQLVGEYLGTGLVATIINGFPVVLIARYDKLTSGRFLYFDQPGCQGTAFVTDVGPNDLATPAAFAPDGTVRVAVSRTGTSRLLSSRYNDQGPLCENVSLTTEAIETQIGPNLKTRFAAPFRLGDAQPAASAAAVPVGGTWLVSVIAVGLAFLGLVRLR